MRRASLLEWKNRGTGSHWGLIFNKAVQLCPNHSAGGSSAPKEGTPGLGWGRCSSSPQREGPCSWAADESCIADRGPSAGVRCYCVRRGGSTPQRSHFLWLLFHSELPALPWSIHSHFFFLYENMSASLHMNLQLVFNAAPPCFFYFVEWVLQLCWENLLYEKWFCLSSQMITLRFCSWSGFIKTVNSVEQGNICVCMYTSMNSQKAICSVQAVTKEQRDCNTFLLTH